MFTKNAKKVFSTIMAMLLSMLFAACVGGEEVANTANLVNPAESFDKSASIEETVLADKCGIKIIAKSLTYNGYSIDINLLIENHSNNDASILSNTLACRSNSVNLLNQIMCKTILKSMIGANF